VAVTNMGNVPLSGNQTIDLSVVARPVGGGPDEPLYTLTKQSVSNLKPGASKNFTCKVVLPAGLPTGNYRLVVLVDSGGRVAESDESNNEVVSDPLAVELGEIDLTGAFGEVKLPTSFVTDRVIQSTARITVRNEGNVPVPSQPAPTVRVVLTRVGGGPEVEIGLATISGTALLPGKSGTLNVSLTVPAWIAQGQYRLSAILDSKDVATESNEANNVLLHASTWDVLYPPPKLVMTSNNVPKKIYSDDIFHVSDTIRNNGGSSSSSTQLTYYLSKNKTLDSGDHMLGSRTVPPLAHGASNTGSTRLSTRSMINPFDTPIPYYILIQLGTSVTAYSTQFMPWQ
ncbi:MAG TPA: CARDB domain-containing protein, partial [Sedimentisphaerales bacterium]|nr:CARDB domain-containing protein [Sedimentisphaerales bacterium]